MLSSLALLALVPAVALAASFNVDVGKDGLVFTPNFISGAVSGDTIVFNFANGNHAVVNSVSFDTPCMEIRSGRRGMEKRLFAAPSSAAGGAMTATLTSDATVWAHCPTSGHCQAGMVFAVNPPTSGAETIDAFRTLAMGGTVSGTSGNTTSPSTGATSQSGAAATTTAGAAATTTAGAAASAAATTTKAKGAGPKEIKVGAGLWMAVGAVAVGWGWVVAV